jgi:hypothetical protein
MKKYTDDPSLSWEERYKRLQAHHVEETEYLVRWPDRLKEEIANLKSEALDNTKKFEELSNAARVAMSRLSTLAWHRDNDPGWGSLSEAVKNLEEIIEKNG